MNASHAQDTIGSQPGARNYDPFNQGRSLYRTEDHIGGVAGGLAQYFGVDPSLMRIGTAVAVIATGPAALAAYAAAWLVFPDAAGKTIVGEDTAPATTYSSEVPS